MWSFQFDPARFKPTVSDLMANAAAAILRKTMIEAGRVYLSRVPVEVEVMIGDTWAEK